MSDHFQAMLEALKGSRWPKNSRDRDGLHCFFAIKVALVFVYRNQRVWDCCPDKYSCFVRQIGRRQLLKLREERLARSQSDGGNLVAERAHTGAILSYDNHRVTEFSNLVCHSNQQCLDPPDIHSIRDEYITSTLRDLRVGAIRPLLLQAIQVFRTHR